MVETSSLLQKKKNVLNNTSSDSGQSQGLRISEKRNMEYTRNSNETNSLSEKENEKKDQRKEIKGYRHICSRVPKN